jgi:uncharacterized membrane protein
MPRKRYSRIKKSIDDTKTTSKEEADEILSILTKIQQKQTKVKKISAKSQPKQKKVFILPVIFVISIIFISIFYFNQPYNDSFSQQTNSGVQSGNNILLKMTDITNTAKFFIYNDNGVTIRYFAARGTDNLVRVATDACDVCFSEKKGYVQAGTVIKCINCGQEFAIDNLGTKNLQGGCWTSYLPFTTDTENIVIKISDLRQKRFMFA